MLSERTLDEGKKTSYKEERKQVLQETKIFCVKIGFLLMIHPLACLKQLAVSLPYLAGY